MLFEFGVLVPPEVVTVTAMVPSAVVAGATAVIEVGEFTVTEVADSVPNFTDAPVTKPVPRMVTDVPPDDGPLVGDSAVGPPTETVGTGAV